MFLQWSVGNKIYNINRSLLTAADGTANQLQDVMTGGPGIPDAKIGNTFESTESSLFIEDGSYLRGKNLRLGYNVPTTWLNAMHLSGMTRLQLYVSAQTYPQVRQITFGFTAGF